MPLRVVGSIDYNHDANAVDLNITAVKYPLWRGTNNNGSGAADWDGLGTLNWVEYSTGVATSYQDFTDFVYFDDSVGAGIKNVNLVGTLQPMQVSVNNDSKTYTFSGTGTISGSTALIKAGPGTLNITNTGNTYTGGTNISQGTLAFGTGSLPIVSSTNTASIIMNGGTLKWYGTNTDDVSDRLSFVSGQTATLDLNGNTVTLASAMGFGSTSPMVLTGSGNVTLTGSSTFTGDLTVNNGTLNANLANNQPSPGLGLSALGNPIVSHNVNINSGATLNFVSSYTMGMPARLR